MRWWSQQKGKSGVETFAGFYPILLVLTSFFQVLMFSEISHLLGFSSTNFMPLV